LNRNNVSKRNNHNATVSGPDAQTNGGGGIYNLNAGTLTIQNAIISNNIANGTVVLVVNLTMLISTSVTNC
jgi:hypothetical protein